MSAIEQRASIQQFGVMNPNPFAMCQRSEWRWLISSQDALNSMNPIDDPWNFDSSTVAKRRLRDVVRADRSQCGDGKWILADAPWDRLCRLGLILAGLSFARQNCAEIAEAYCRAAKTRYRWEVRR
ncbi:hypothetical protein [Stenotrophomonas sp. NPDC078853]|uniref:hypothetical protein n=1 Tax=Stenotrophomonas sp. NPDC078853 TaxID=3364534 RepID=UPI00384E244E